MTGGALVIVGTFAFRAQCRGPTSAPSGAPCLPRPILVALAVCFEVSAASPVHRPRCAHGGEARIPPDWAKSLEAHREPSHQGRCVDIPTAAAWPNLGWESATKQWGGKNLPEELEILCDIQRDCGRAI